jgi:hypothetical protein
MRVAAQITPVRANPRGPIGGQVAPISARRARLRLVACAVRPSTGSSHKCSVRPADGCPHLHDRARVPAVYGACARTSSHGAGIAPREQTALNPPAERAADVGSVLGFLLEGELSAALGQDVYGMSTGVSRSRARRGRPGGRARSCPAAHDRRLRPGACGSRPRPGPGCPMR